MKNNQSTKYCELCGNEFTSIRPDAKFCSNSCRTKANKQRRDSELKAAENVKKQAEIEDLQRQASDARKLKKANAAAAKAEKLRLEELATEARKAKAAEDEAEKQRIVDEANKQKRLKDQERKNRLTEHKERIKKSENEKYDRRMRLFNTGVELLTGWFSMRNQNHNNKLNGPQNPPKGSDSTPTSKSLPQLPPTTTNPENDGTILTDSHAPGSTNDPVNPNEPCELTTAENEAADQEKKDT
jgi:predicted nucleic acid-binding Zn ribbon protein